MARSIYMPWRDSQELCISIETWQYKVLVGSDRSHRTIFQFEGIVPGNSEGVKGISVIGNIEVPVSAKVKGEQIEVNDIDEHDSRSKKQGELIVAHSIGDPILGVTLYCRNEAYQELFRVFSAAFSNVGSIVLVLHLRRPSDAKEDFWDISHFDIVIGGRKLGSYTRGRK